MNNPLPRSLRSWVAELALSCASHRSITSFNFVFGLLLLGASFQTGKQWKDEYSGKRLAGLYPNLSESFSETYTVSGWEDLTLSKLSCQGRIKSFLLIVLLKPQINTAPLSFNIPLDLIS